eukprot:TRINITY_DN16624_c0_g3_i2.p2 TRINITY_DN16624_c0_g3~~TRINITY_DN16624_c0_g3_i2.p2  ORF type:complete len:289 (+),score=37.79 TRINITY_DN16624_c0_g3_i2:63-929(+)
MSARASTGCKGRPASAPAKGKAAAPKAASRTAAEGSAGAGQRGTEAARPEREEGDLGVVVRFDSRDIQKDAELVRVRRSRRHNGREWIHAAAEGAERRGALSIAGLLRPEVRRGCDLDSADVLIEADAEAALDLVLSGNDVEDAKRWVARRRRLAQSTQATEELLWCARNRPICEGGSARRGLVRGTEAGHQKVRDVDGVICGPPGEDSQRPLSARESRLWIPLAACSPAARAGRPPVRDIAGVAGATAFRTPRRGALKVGQSSMGLAGRRRSCAGRALHFWREMNEH